MAFVFRRPSLRWWRRRALSHPSVGKISGSASVSLRTAFKGVGLQNVGGNSRLYSQEFVSTQPKITITGSANARLSESGSVVAPLTFNIVGAVQLKEKANNTASGLQKIVGSTSLKDQTTLQAGGSQKVAGAGSSGSIVVNRNAYKIVVTVIGRVGQVVSSKVGFVSTIMVTSKIASVSKAFMFGLVAQAGTSASSAVTKIFGTGIPRISSATRVYEKTTAQANAKPQIIASGRLNESAYSSVSPAQKIVASTKSAETSYLRVVGTQNILGYAKSEDVVNSRAGFTQKIAASSRVSDETGLFAAGFQKIPASAKSSMYNNNRGLLSGIGSLVATARLAIFTQLNAFARQKIVGSGRSNEVASSHVTGIQQIPGLATTHGITSLRLNGIQHIKALANNGISTSAKAVVEVYGALVAAATVRVSASLRGRGFENLSGFGNLRNSLTTNVNGLQKLPAKAVLHSVIAAYGVVANTGKLTAAIVSGARTFIAGKSALSINPMAALSATTKLQPSGSQSIPGKITTVAKSYLRVAIGPQQIFAQGKLNSWLRLLSTNSIFVKIPPFLLSYVFEPNFNVRVNATPVPLINLNTEAYFIVRVNATPAPLINLNIEAPLIMMVNTAPAPLIMRVNATPVPLINLNTEAHFILEYIPN